MKTFALVAASILALVSGVAAAQSNADRSRGLDQAMESVDKNLEKHPDNKGLRNAKERLEENKHRQHGRPMDRNRGERMAGMDRPERAEHAERPEHVERPERPEGVDRSGRR